MSDTSFKSTYLEFTVLGVSSCTGGLSRPPTSPATSLPLSSAELCLVGESGDTHLGEVDWQRGISLACGKLPHYQKQLCFYTEKKNHGVEAADLSLLIIQFFLWVCVLIITGWGGSHSFFFSRVLFILFLWDLNGNFEILGFFFALYKSSENMISSPHHRGKRYQWDKTRLMRNHNFLNKGV